jgi:undecaprenyl-diphosphatase
MRSFAFVALVAAWFLVGCLCWRNGGAERLGALTALMAAGVALLANQAISLLWDRPRPFVAHPGSVHMLISHGADGGFPSDHVAAAFAIALALVVVHRRLGIVLLVGAALLAYSRVYVGVHYPGDVVAGSAIGVLAAIVSRRWLIPGLMVLARSAQRRLPKRPIHVPRAEILERTAVSLP